MSDFFRRHSLLLTAFLLLALSCQLMSISIKNAAIPRWGAKIVNSVISPIQELHHELFLSVRKVWSRYIALQNVEVERDKLSERLKNLEAENSRLIEFENENERLRKLLAYKGATGAAGVTATVIGVSGGQKGRGENRQFAGTKAVVIGHEPSNWARTITIDKGFADGVKVGMPVVDGNALVGQTIVVNTNSSRVLLVTDSTSAIDAVVQTSRAQGIVEGIWEEKLKLRYVSRELTVNVGDRVIASGLDGVYPKGTLIGVVTNVDKGTGGLFQAIELQPSADLNRVENVFVITMPGQAGDD